MSEQKPAIACLDVSITNTGIAVLLDDGTIGVASLADKSFSNHGYLRSFVRTYLRGFLSMVKFRKIAAIKDGMIVASDPTTGKYDCTIVDISLCSNVFFEGAAYLKNNKSVMLNQFNGIVASNFVAADILEVAPKSHKKTFVGNGNATKQDTIDVVLAKFGFKTKDDNIADALSLLYHVLSKGLAKENGAERFNLQ